MESRRSSIARLPRGVSAAEREREKKGFTHQQLGEKGKEGKAQLDYIIGPKWKWDKSYIYNDEKVWDSCDRCRVYVSRQRDERRNGQDGGQKPTSKKLNSRKM